MSISCPYQWHASLAARIIRAGGVVAYPTETTWGLGCDPFQQSAVERILRIKQRPMHKGLIVIADHLEQLSGLIEPLTEAQQEMIQKHTAKPTTWIVPAASYAPEWISGQHSSVAVRITTHPLSREICRRVGPIVSTSANRAGQPVLTARWPCVRQFYQEVDWILPGQSGSASSASQIIDLLTGKILRH
ncbi:Sua5/YciO/YrdC/YwlC family protein [Pleionea sp. CnH1-48]|uniref:L-threonylcarbamoyladenylate synthase n=1 Tax=Pleionea sp. CnH1-48 TaxID=2954494 RepID=UPI002098070E|nr:Sua5/YciO/YrdC/YwlC family protein [Pleionea sp. CnH1-48]